jgi:hypothetical protein
LTGFTDVTLGGWLVVTFVAAAAFTFKNSAKANSNKIDNNNFRLIVTTSNFPVPTQKI